MARGVAEELGEAVLKDSGALSEAEWLARIDKVGQREGFFRYLGADHAALFVARKPTLIVTFETSETIRKREVDQMPFGLTVSEMRDWSHLCVIARTDSWYRDQAVYDLFDKLVDDSFFERFEQVVFFGSGMAGYAAAAFSVTAPGATVVLLQPQATLDPAVTGWDPRFAEHRRKNFTDRYGYAPDMTEGAGQVFVIFDPDQTLDAMHAALFRRPFATLLPVRNAGPDLYASLSSMQILQPILLSAAANSFDAQMFWTFFRARRNNIPYLRRLLSKLEADGRPHLAAMVAGNAGNRLGDAKFRRRAEELVRQVSRVGVQAPA